MTAAAIAGEVSDKDLDVIRQLVDGRTVRAIARRARITPTAVSMRMHRLAIRLGTDNILQTVLAVDRAGLLGPDTHRAQTVRREVADRHSSTCALLRPQMCDCDAYDPPARENGAA